MRVLGTGPVVAGPGRYELEFLSKEVETPTSSTYRFATGGSGFGYRSNQAVRLFLPGSGDPRPWRTFSLSSSPSETDHIAFTAKRTGSPFKAALERLDPGDRVLVVGPVGDLIYDPARPALLLAGGIGVTPFRGMLRYAADTGGTEPVVLLYSARTPEELAFRSELDAISRDHPHLAVRYSVTRPGDSALPWTGRTGRIDEGWIRDALAGLARPKVYVVGVPAMARELLLLLRSRFGFSEDELEYEFFMGY